MNVINRRRQKNMSTERASEEDSSLPTAEEETDMVNRITTRLQTAMAPAIASEVKKAIQGAKRELSDIAEEACAKNVDAFAERAAKKVRKDVPEFKKKGTKAQWIHNKDVLDEVEAALVAVGKRDADVAKEKLTEGKRLLLKRLKAIKIADREEHGWAVVRHYESDDLASDTEDEKDIGRARRAAAAENKKQKEKMKLKSKRKWFPRKFSPTYNTSYPSYGQSASRPLSKNSQTICFGCGKEGHMQFLYGEKQEILKT